jgi:hypothetical protein
VTKINHCTISIPGKGTAKSGKLKEVIGFGFPEADDRSHVWRVPPANTSGRHWPPVA